jgi:YD repeat-containing protein
LGCSRLDRLTDGNGNLIVDYDYHPFSGLLAKETNGNGTYTNYNYDLAGQLISLVNSKADSSVNSRFDYTYDNLGRRTAVATLDGTWNYNYDLTGQLTGAVFTSTNSSISNQNLTYVYDAAGNRTQTIVNGVTENYATNNLNQYQTAGTTTYSYDLDGNLISKTKGGEAWCFEFNKFNSNIVGTYSYQSPKDTAQICIEGFAKDNQVKGVGYELIQYGETKPDIQEEKLRISQDTSFVSKEGYWDNSQSGDETGNNLKVDSPHFYKLIEPEQEGNDYWVWMRFDIAQLDLSKFYQRELRTSRYQGKLREVIPVANCVN